MKRPRTAGHSDNQQWHADGIQSRAAPAAGAVHKSQECSPVVSRQAVVSLVGLTFWVRGRGGGGTIAHTRRPLLSGVLQIGPCETLPALPTAPFGRNKTIIHSDVHSLVTLQEGSG